MKRQIVIEQQNDGSWKAIKERRYDRKTAKEYFDNLLADLAACEAALAEEQRKNAELEVRIAKLIEAGDAMYTHGDFTRSYSSVDSDWSKLTTNLPQPPERSV